MAARDKWCQIRMTADELADLDRLVNRMKPQGRADNRADAIRALVFAEHARLDRSDARSEKKAKSGE